MIEAEEARGTPRATLAIVAEDVVMTVSPLSLVVVKTISVGEGVMVGR